jgi:hypothetical protein
MSEKQLGFYSSLITHYPSLLFLRFLLDLHYFAAFVIATLWADAMRHPWLLAIRADGCLRRSERIMCAALARTRFGMTAFWIRHDNSSK